MARAGTVHIRVAGRIAVVSCVGILASMASSMIIPFAGDEALSLGLYGTFDVAMIGASFLLYWGEAG